MTHDQSRRFLILLLLPGLLGWIGLAASLPKGFVYLDQAIPGIKLDIRYFGSDNFVGAPVDGYRAPRAILTHAAAQALRAAQSDLAPFGLQLKIFDGYRPQRAVNHFVRWAADANDQKTKAQHYPAVDKRDLFAKGYIAKKSGHSRGSTVDLTLIVRDAAGALRELDMGTPFDFMGPESWPTAVAVAGEQRAHRLLLRTIMEKHGFIAYEQEWWHFTLKNEPFPNTYFDFPVE